jgi:hypothetical protein
MPNIFLPAFLWSVPVGAVVFALAWLPSRRLTQRSKLWRITLSTVAALAVAPSVGDFCGSQTIVPAVLFLAMSIFSASADLLTRLPVFARGALPVLILAAVIFYVWSYFETRRRAA